MKTAKIDRDSMTTDQNEGLPDEIFATVDGTGDDAYRNTYSAQIDAVESNDKSGTLVATYRLVKVETLALKQSVKLVTVKP